MVVRPVLLKLTCPGTLFNVEVMELVFCGTHFGKHRVTLSASLVPNPTHPRSPDSPLLHHHSYFFSLSHVPTPRRQPPCLHMASLVAQTVKGSACSEGDPGSAPGLGRSPGEGHGNPLQYSGLENPMDRGAWPATQSKGSQRVKQG